MPTQKLALLNSQTCESVQPRYRVVADSFYLYSIHRPKGSEFEHLGWPIKGLEPINESAKKIAAYHARNALNPFLPLSPYDRGLTRFFLPAVIAWPGLPRRIHPVPEVGPVYRVTREGDIDGDVKVGDFVCLLSWPDGFKHHPAVGAAAVEPANEAARTVSAYYEKFRDHKGLRSSPWCEFEGSLILPELQAPAMPSNKYFDASAPLREAPKRAQTRQGRSGEAA